MIELTMPWPPSVNGYWRSFRGRQIISKKGREYRAAAVAAVVDQKHYGTKLSGPLAVSLRLSPPDRRRRDIDNYTKALFDAMTEAKLWGDDHQIKSLQVTMLNPTKSGSVEVAIEPVGEPNIQPESAYD